MDGLQLKILQKAKRNIDLLSKWERDFVENLELKGKDHKLSPSQKKKLHEIWDKTSVKRQKATTQRKNQFVQL